MEALFYARGIQYSVVESFTLLPRPCGYVSSLHCPAGVLLWGVQKVHSKDGTVNHKKTVRLTVGGGGMKEVVRFGTFRTLEDAITARDMIVLKLKADRRAVIKRDARFIRACAQLDWNEFWQRLGSMRIYGKSGPKEFKPSKLKLLQKAWVASHTLLAQDVTLEADVRDRAQQLASSMTSLLREGGDDDI